MNLKILFIFIIDVCLVGFVSVSVVFTAAALIDFLFLFQILYNYAPLVNITNTIVASLTLFFRLPEKDIYIHAYICTYMCIELKIFFLYFNVN